MKKRIGTIERTIYRPNGWFVEKVLARYAYAKNSNAHNPTAYYFWTVRDREGNLWFTGLPTLKAAKALADGKGTF